MKFFRLKFNKADIFIIPIMCVVMFVVQYNIVTKSNEKDDKKLNEKLENLAKECRSGKQKSCDEYTEIINKITKSEKS